MLVNQFRLISYLPCVHPDNDIGLKWLRGWMKNERQKYEKQKKSAAKSTLSLKKSVAKRGSRQKFNSER